MFTKVKTDSKSLLLVKSLGADPLKVGADPLKVGADPLKVGADPSEVVVLVPNGRNMVIK